MRHLNQEIRAGFATYLTMAYILFVNPQILATAITVPQGFAQLLTATALAASFGSILMGILSRYPFAMAPGMGLNAFFAYSVVGAAGVPWQTALGAVFIAGIAFVLLSLIGARTALVDAIPQPIKMATTSGIGLFLAFIGFKNMGLVVADENTLLALGDMRSGGVLLGVFGVFLIAGLLAKKVKGAVLIGIGGVTVLAMVSGAAVFNDEVFSGLPNGLVQMPVWPKDLFFALDFTGMLSWSLVSVVVMFLFVDFFDTAGTLFGLAEKSGYLQADGSLLRADRAFMADGIATAAGALVGMSPTTTYIESAAGIEEGGRTGMSAVVVGVLFLLSIFFWPLASVVPMVATAPVLVVVGSLMLSSVGRIEWQDVGVALPCFLTIVLMPLTFSISHGIAFGLISWVGVQVIAGKAKQVDGLLWLLVALLLSRYLFL